MKFEKKLQPIENRELSNLFPLLKDLFKFAESKGVNTLAFQKYTGENEEENLNSIELPEKFLSLFPEHPGKYYLVGYENRKNPYYKEGTRNIWVRLSTVAKKIQTNEKIREIDIEEADMSEGNIMRTKVTDSIKNADFSQINTAEGDEVEQPHGSAQYIYETTPNGKKKITETSFNRLDEGLFLWKGKDQPVRWLRDLNMKKNKAGYSKFVYTDSYIIDRCNVRANIKTTINGSLENPESIVVEIGHGSLNSAEIIYEDPEGKIKVYKHSGVQDDGMKVVKQDPNYSPLFEEKINPDELLETLRFKMLALKDDWDKPQNVFSDNKSLNEMKNKITNHEMHF